jgi:hypothetical protein
MAAAGVPDDGALALHERMTRRVPLALRVAHQARDTYRWTCKELQVSCALIVARSLRRAGPPGAAAWSFDIFALDKDGTCPLTVHAPRNAVYEFFLMPLEQRLFGPLGASQPARCTLFWSDRGSMDRALQLSSSSHAAVLRTPSRHPASPLDWRAKLTAPARRAALELFVEHLFERCASCLRAGRV